MASRQGCYHEVRIVVLCKNHGGNVSLCGLGLFQTAQNPRKLIDFGARELKPIALKAQGILKSDTLLA